MCVCVCVCVCVCMCVCVCVHAQVHSCLLSDDLRSELPKVKQLSIEGVHGQHENNLCHSFTETMLILKYITWTKPGNINRHIHNDLHNKPHNPYISM